MITTGLVPQTLREDAYQLTQGHVHATARPTHHSQKQGQEPSKLFQTHLSKPRFLWVTFCPWSPLSSKRIIDLFSRNPGFIVLYP